MKPRKVTVEIVSSGNPQDVIAGLLEACRWVHNGYGNSYTDNDTTTVTMRVNTAFERQALTTCDKCGKVKPADDTGCFGCLVTEIVNHTARSV